MFELLHVCTVVWQISIFNNYHIIYVKISYRKFCTIPIPSLIINRRLKCSMGIFSYNSNCMKNLPQWRFPKPLYMYIVFNKLLHTWYWHKYIRLLEKGRVILQVCQLWIIAASPVHLFTQCLAILLSIKITNMIKFAVNV